MKLIGRKYEIENLKRAHNSHNSELIALYGRRRVGKTFLVREVFKKQFVFEVTGLYNGIMSDQLTNFSRALSKQQRKNKTAIPATWFDAFAQLEKRLEKLKSGKKKVVFIDEFPWLATARSKFLMAFENFWNSYCTKRNDLIVVICGSAASFMIQKIILNKGGLHNRITRQIRLLPFNLRESELFLKSRGINYTPYDIVKIYMMIGGVPHYLEQFQKGRSVAQNIDDLCFSKEGALHNEFEKLFVSLFQDSEKHLAIIKTLAQSQNGLIRKELLQKSQLNSGGDSTLKLRELIESGFISEYKYFGNKRQLTLFRLSDEYSKFYLKFIQNNRDSGAGTWQRLQAKQNYKIWTGFAFETLCLKHINQIKSALGVASVFTRNSSWFNTEAQIDLLIDRDDNIINVCEIKFYNDPFVIDKNYYLNLKNKLTAFKEASRTNKNIFLIMITSYGIKENKYSRELVQNSIQLTDLFNE